MKTLCGLLVATVLMAGNALGQSNPCGDLPVSELQTERVGSVLFSDNPVAEQIRSSLGIQQLPATAAKQVVSDNQTCRQIGRKLERELKKAPDWQEIRRDGYRVQFYEFGPYYAAKVVLNPPEGVVREGYSLLELFDKATLDYIGTVSI